MAKTKAMKIPVTIRALLQRINRKLAAQGETLRATRGERWRSECGDYYAVDVNRNTIIAQHVDPEKWGRELGVLKPYEEVKD